MSATPWSSVVGRVDDRADQLADLARTLRDRVLSRSFRLPLLPESVQTLLSLAVDSTSSTRELEAAIRHEPLLAAKVVGCANSSLHAARGGVTSLHQAAVRLGSGTLRELISQAIAEAHVFSGRPRARLAQLRTHSIAVGYLSRFTCALLDADEQYAFLCGLLHDMGHPIVLSMLSSEPLAKNLTNEERGMLCELLHPLVGERVARAWHLPDQVSEVCRFHHCYLGQETHASGQSPNMTIVVAAADQLACRIGVGDRDLGSDSKDDLIWHALGLDEDRLTSLRDYGDRIADAVI